jgi:hypothetical protein
VLGSPDVLLHLQRKLDNLSIVVELILCGVQGVMRVACLFDGTAWGLVMPDHLFALGTVNIMGNEKIHATLLDAYLEKYPSYSAVPDDGYIMQVGVSTHSFHKLP